MHDIIARPFHHTSFIVCCIELECHWLRVRIDKENVQQNVTNCAVFTLICLIAFTVGSCNESYVFSCLIKLNLGLFWLLSLIIETNVLQTMKVNKREKVCFWDAELCVDIWLGN